MLTQRDKLAQALESLTEAQLGRALQINKHNYDWWELHYTPSMRKRCLAGHVFDLRLGERKKDMADLADEDRQFMSELSTLSCGLPVEDVLELVRAECRRRTRIDEGLEVTW